MREKIEILYICSKKPSTLLKLVKISPFCSTQIVQEKWLAVSAGHNFEAFGPRFEVL